MRLREAVLTVSAEQSVRAACGCYSNEEGVPDLAELRNIKSVTTGFKYSQSDDERPRHQYCYAHTTKSIGNSNLRVDVANFLKGKLQPIIIDEKSLSEFNITRITFEQLVDYCQFDRL